mgnify:CR=1 FL=1
MKFSFEAGEYRKDLADSLKAKRAESRTEAKGLLEQERVTLNYKVSADIKKVLAKIEGKQPNQEEEEGLASKEVSTKVFKMEGSDGVEHEIEVHTLDISDKIPDTLKLAHDIYRLLVLDYKLSHLNVGPDIITQFAEGYLYETLKYPSVRGLINLYLSAKTKGEDRNLFLTNWPQLSDEDKKKFSEVSKKLKYETDEIVKLATQDNKGLCDVITEGAFLDEKTFAHVVGAYEEGYDMNLEEDSPEKYASLKNRYPHARPDEIVGEQMLDVSDAKSKELWFHAGGADYNNSFKMMLLCNSESERFKKEVNGFSSYNSGITGEQFTKYLQNIQPDKSKISMDDKMKAAVMMAGEQPSGICINFKREEPWLFIADWIVDLYHRRLYKITEKQADKI